MKKYYIKPVSRVLMIDTEHIVCTSNGAPDETSLGQGDPNDGQAKPQVTTMWGKNGLWAE